jgi:CheY-like chemotaxis protein
MEARKQSPDLFILNLFMPRADGFRMMDAILVDERTRGRPVVLLLPPALTPTQIQQLAVWVDHCRQDLAVEGEELKRKVLAAFKGLETA